MKAGNFFLQRLTFQRFVRSDHAVIGIILFYQICRNIFDNKALSVTAAGLIAVNFHLIHFAWQMMSEISFLFFIVLTFYFLILAL